MIPVIELMNLEDQVDLDFTRARRRARLGRLKRLLLSQATRRTLLSPKEFQRSTPPSGSMYRGRRTLEVSKIVGSVGKHEQFDMHFMPLSGASSGEVEANRQSFSARAGGSSGEPARAGRDLLRQ